MRKLMVLSLLALSISWTACQKNSTEPFNEEEDFNSIMLQAFDDEVGYMSGQGLGLDSVDAVFTLSWGRMSLPRLPFKINTGQAMALALPQDQDPRFYRGGLDMGEVTLTTPDDQIVLTAFQGFGGGFVYTSFPRPGKGVKDGRRNGNGPFGRFNFNSLEFKASSEYSFETAGSDEFPAMKVRLTTPASRLSLASVNDGAALDTTRALNISWSGGSADDHVLVALLAFASPNGRPGFVNGEKPNPEDMRLGFGNRPILVKVLDRNDGTITFTAEEWTSILDNFDAKSVMVHVAAINGQRETISGREVAKIVRLQDRTIVDLQ